jgi:hypothetical protein
LFFYCPVWQYLQQAATALLPMYQNNFYALTPKALYQSGQSNTGSTEHKKTTATRAGKTHSLQLTVGLVSGKNRLL